MVTSMMHIKNYVGLSSVVWKKWKSHSNPVVIEGKEEVKAVWTFYFEVLLNEPAGEQDVTEEIMPNQVTLIDKQKSCGRYE